MHGDRSGGGRAAALAVKHDVAPADVDVTGLRDALRRDGQLPTVMFINVWAGFGYNMVIYLAGLQSIPQDLYEAADIDGAGRLGQIPLSSSSHC